MIKQEIISKYKNECERAYRSVMNYDKKLSSFNYIMASSVDSFRRIVGSDIYSVENELRSILRTYQSKF